MNKKQDNYVLEMENRKIRRLTPKECERLQAFPDDWTRYGSDGEEISDTQRYKCLGNAVTTTVVTYLIEEMFKGILKMKLKNLIDNVNDNVFKKETTPVVFIEGVGHLYLIFNF